MLQMDKKFKSWSSFKRVAESATPLPFSPHEVVYIYLGRLDFICFIVLLGRQVSYPSRPTPICA